MKVSDIVCAAAVALPNNQRTPKRTFIDLWPWPHPAPRCAIASRRAGTRSGRALSPSLCARQVISAVLAGSPRDSAEEPELSDPGAVCNRCSAVGTSHSIAACPAAIAYRASRPGFGFHFGLQPGGQRRQSCEQIPEDDENEFASC